MTIINIKQAYRSIEALVVTARQSAIYARRVTSKPIEIPYRPKSYALIVV